MTDKKIIKTTKYSNALTFDDLSSASITLSSPLKLLKYIYVSWLNGLTKKSKKPGELALFWLLFYVFGFSTAI